MLKIFFAVFGAIIAAAGVLFIAYGGLTTFANWQTWKGTSLRPLQENDNLLDRTLDDSRKIRTEHRSIEKPFFEEAPKEIIHLIERVQLAEDLALDPGTRVSLENLEGDYLTFGYEGAQYTVPAWQTDVP